MSDDVEREERLDEGVHVPAVRCEGCGEEVDMRDCHTRSAVAERWNDHIEAHGESA